jgi:hypothetical protein
LTSQGKRLRLYVKKQPTVEPGRSVNAQRSNRAANADTNLSSTAKAAAGTDTKADSAR